MSSSSTIRIATGDTIQIRTGVVSGIGPQGPTGPTGPPGPVGATGVQGLPGPTGFIAEYAGEFKQASPQSLASGQASLVVFDTVVRDDFSAAKSTTNFGPGVGDYNVNAYIQISKRSNANAVGSRTVRLLLNGTVVTATSVAAAPTVAHEAVLATSLHVNASTDILSIQVLHDEGTTLSISAARLWINRTGPGAVGPAGPIGPQGTVGATGAQGIQGPAGTIGNNSTTFAQLEAGTG